MITIGQFLMTQSATNWSLVQIQSHTFGQDCPDGAHDGVSILRDHHDQGSPFGTTWHTRIGSGAFISN